MKKDNKLVGKGNYKRKVNVKCRNCDHKQQYTTEGLFFCSICHGSKYDPIIEVIK